MNPPDVSILICTRDRAESLRQTVAAIAEAVTAAKGITCELVVVDDGSEDAEAVRSAVAEGGGTARYVRGEGRGLSLARDLALAEATGVVALFTDDDVRPRDGWIEKMARPILDGADAVAGAVVIAPDLERDWLSPDVRMLMAATDSLDFHDVSGLVGANMAVRRSVALEIGFDEELGAGRLAQGKRRSSTPSFVIGGMTLSVPLTLSWSTISTRHGWTERSCSSVPASPARHGRGSTITSCTSLSGRPSPAAFE